MLAHNRANLISRLIVYKLVLPSSSKSAFANISRGKLCFLVSDITCECRFGVIFAYFTEVDIHLKKIVS